MTLQYTGSYEGTKGGYEVGPSGKSKYIHGCSHSGCITFLVYWFNFSVYAILIQLLNLCKHDWSESYVIIADVEASNGVIHAINAFIL